MDHRFCTVLSRIVGLILLLPTLPQMGAGLRMRGAFAVWLAWIIQMTNPAPIIGTGIVEIAIDLVGGISYRLGTRARHPTRRRRIPFRWRSCRCQYGFGHGCRGRSIIWFSYQSTVRLLQWGAVLIFCHL